MLNRGIEPVRYKGQYSAKWWLTQTWPHHIHGRHFRHRGRGGRSKFLTAALCFSVNIPDQGEGEALHNTTFHHTVFGYANCPTFLKGFSSFGSQKWA